MRRVACSSVIWTVLGCLADAQSSRAAAALASWTTAQLVDSFRLDPSPGLSFQYGCHEWAASGFNGVVRGYRGSGPVEWWVMKSWNSSGSR